MGCSASIAPWHLFLLFVTIGGEEGSCLNVNTVVIQVCDTVAELGGVLVSQKEWTELLPFLFERVRSNQPELMETALTVFANLVPEVTEELTGSLPQLHAMLQACLVHSSPDVRLAALRAGTALVLVCRIFRWLLVRHFYVHTITEAICIVVL